MPDSHLLRGGGVCLLVDLTGDDPVVVHWGADLGEPLPDPALLAPPVAGSAFDVAVRPSLLPQLARGWRGRPALRGSRDGRGFSPLLALTGREGDEGRLALALADLEAGLEVRVMLQLDATGLLVLDRAVTNTGDGPYLLERADAVLPVPATAVESLDQTGRWI